jgi:hypothetical protein
VFTSQPFDATPSQSVKPELQLYRQEVPSQVEVAFGTGAHGVQDVPHDETDVFERQFPPHAW